MKPPVRRYLHRIMARPKKIAKIDRVERGFVVTVPEEMMARSGLGTGDELVAEAAGQ